MLTSCLSGTSAYIGAAKYISNKEYLTAAASILSTEARHAAWVASAVNQHQPWSGAFDVPLEFSEVYTLAAAFITSCPDSNPSLPVKAFASLTIGDGQPGDKVSVEYNGSENVNGTAYLAFMMGLMQQIVEIDDGMVTLPANLTGTAYVVVTTNSTMATDDNIVAGPSILTYDFQA